MPNAHLNMVFSMSHTNCLKTNCLRFEFESCDRSIYYSNATSGFEEVKSLSFFIRKIEIEVHLMLIVIYSPVLYPCLLSQSFLQDGR